MQNPFSKFIAVIFAFISVSARAETNFWIAPGGGDWADTNAWSLGILPDSSQSVVINAARSNIVEIGAATVQESPQSLAADDMFISGTNSLSLNWADPGKAFRILRDCSVSGGATLNISESLLQIGGDLWITNGGTVIENNGGLTNEWIQMLSGWGGAICSLTNVSLKSGGIGLMYGSRFTQEGGTAELRSITSYSGGFEFHHVDLTVSEGTWVSTIQGGGGFLQEDSTNRSPELSVFSGFEPVTYTQRGGLLCTSNEMINADLKHAEFQQIGGVHIVTNSIKLTGVSGVYYGIGDGSLSAHAVLLDGSSGLCHFSAGNSTITVAGDIQFIGRSNLLGSGISVRDGTLACSNLVVEGGVLDIGQIGATVSVSNLFSFGGYYIGEWYYADGWKWGGARFGRYEFSSGTLFASNIELAADWFIGSSSETGRITNPGYFKMAGFLSISNDTEQLGRFILASNAVINFAGTNTSLSFADSSAEDWNLNAILLVTNWSGSGSNRLRFGTNQFALTPDQIATVRFRPLDESGLYSAKILSTGEIVPDKPISGAVRVAEENEKLMLDWESGWILQTATNIAGPYKDLPDAIPPFTDTMTAEPERFFRLR